MAKRKASAALFSADPPTSNSATNDLPTDDSLNVAHDSIKEMKGGNKELEVQIETLQKANSQLFQEKSDLTDKVAECLEKSEKLVMQLKEKDAQLEQLQSQFNILQEEYDKVLLTVSQLSYENAKLKEGSQKFESLTEDISQNQAPAQYTRKVSYTNKGRKQKIIPTNGYESWN